MRTKIIKCRFTDHEGNPRGREYSYYSDIPVDVGMMVDVPTTPQNSTEMANPQTKKVIVTAVDVPESEIEAFKDCVKTIVGIHKEE